MPKHALTMMRIEGFCCPLPLLLYAKRKVRQGGGWGEGRGREGVLL